jgi:hypothetical protein
MGRHTSLQVFEVEDGLTVRPDCAYMIPPKRDMAFLRERAICIVLSDGGVDYPLPPAEMASQQIAADQCLLHRQRECRGISKGDPMPNPGHHRVAAAMVEASGNIALLTEMESIVEPVRHAAPIGPIVTEPVTNALKHAFPGSRPEVIKISLKRTTAGARLEVGDDGIGLPEGFALSGSAGMGLDLVRVLSSQIDGCFRIESGAGTRCIVESALAIEAAT